MKTVEFVTQTDPRVTYQGVYMPLEDEESDQDRAVYVQFSYRMEEMDN
jgi:hypothetical protein